MALLRFDFMIINEVRFITVVTRSELLISVRLSNIFPIRFSRYNSQEQLSNPKYLKAKRYDPAKKDTIHRQQHQVFHSARHNVQTDELTLASH
jgi:hypothetical protein